MLSHLNGFHLLSTFDFDPSMDLKTLYFSLILRIIAKHKLIVTI